MDMANGVKTNNMANMDNMAKEEPNIDWVVDELYNRFEEEINDANSYFKMGKIAMKWHCLEMAEGLFMISRDEFTHADFIRDTVIAHGCDIPYEHEEMFEDLEMKMKCMFG